MSGATLDTSVVVAGLAAWHEQHDLAALALVGVEALPAQVHLETYAVLTRLPGGLAVGPVDAARVLAGRFPAPPLVLDDVARAELPGRLAAAGVHGGASYDGLVALQAAAHGRSLLSLDARGMRTYAALGVAARTLTD